MSIKGIDGLGGLGMIAAMRTIIPLLFSLLAGLAPALAQTPAYSTSTAGTIAVTNTFQSALTAPASTTVRRGCTIQNTGSNNMLVFFGSGSPTLTTALRLVPNGSIRCDIGLFVLQDPIWITGTAADTFVVMSQ